MKSNIYINIQTNEKGNEKRYATETAPYYIYSYSNPAMILYKPMATALRWLPGLPATLITSSPLPTVWQMRENCRRYVPTAYEA